MFEIKWTMTDPNGAPVSFTLGDGANIEEVKRVAALRLQLIPILAGQGWKIETAEQAAPTATHPPEDAPRVDPRSKYFQAQTLSMTTEDDKQFFKVKGGQWSKFGITVYPEVLKAAGLAEKSQPLDGWTAYYIETEKDGATQRKVIKLEKF